MSQLGVPNYVHSTKETLSLLGGVGGEMQGRKWEVGLLCKFFLEKLNNNKEKQNKKGNQANSHNIVIETYYIPI